MLEIEINFHYEKSGVLQLGNLVPTTFFQLLLCSLPYNYNHNVMLTSLFIHSSKSNAWHFEDFWVNLF
jgi:hypothetical protein